MLLRRNENYVEEDFQISVAANILRHPTDVRIIISLIDEKNINLEEFALELGLSENILAHHLHGLRKSGIIEIKHIESELVYSVNKDNLKKHLKPLSQFIKKTT